MQALQSICTQSTIRDKITTLDFTFNVVLNVMDHSPTWTSPFYLSIFFAYSLDLIAIYDIFAK